jgi:hypothetical protein
LRRASKASKSSRALVLADPRQRVDAPERADVEGTLGSAEIVFGLVAAHVGSVAKRLLESEQRALEARVVWRQEADLAHQQDARVELAAAEAFDERLALLAPCLLDDLGADDLGPAVPERGPLVLGEAARDLGQPVAGGCGRCSPRSSQRSWA